MRQYHPYEKKISNTVLLMTYRMWSQHFMTTTTMIEYSLGFGDFSSDLSREVEIYILDNDIISPCILTRNDNLKNVKTCNVTIGDDDDYILGIPIYYVSEPHTSIKKTLEDTWTA